jgi:hypothetical protein
MATNWDNIGGGMLGAGLNLWAGNQAVDAARSAADRAAGSDEQRRAAYGTYSGQLAGLAPEVSAGMQMRPATATTGFAKSSIDPTTGQVGYGLNAQTQGMFDKYMQGAKQSVDLAGGFNPEEMAAKRFAAQQKLLAPQRAAEEAALTRKLQKQGLLGVGSTQGVAEGGAAQNPYMAALQGARAQSDARAAYDSLNEGESYLDRLLGRSKGMFSAAEGVDATGRKALDVAGDWTNRFTSNEANRAKTVADLKARAFEAQRQGAFDQTAMDRILEARKGADAAKVARTSGLASPSNVGMFSNLLGSGGLNLFGKVGGLFGSGSGSNFYDGGQSYSYDVPSLDYGSTWDSGAAYTPFDMIPSGVEF